MIKFPQLLIRSAAWVLLLSFATGHVFGGDWPMWRYDSGRRAATPAELPEQMHLNWVRELPEPRRAWRAQGDDLDKLEFDLSYQPVAAGGTLFVPCMVKDRVLAFDTATGTEKWRFYASGPVRFAPVVWRNRVYFISDDGGLYCLKAETGELLWRFAGTPAAQKVLGTERLISMWPARGGPVLHEGVIYFSAGIWPFLGIFIHAVDAETGENLWTNSGSGANYDLHQHGGAFAYGGVAPQGYLAVSGDKLIVSGGRTPPAIYERETGEFLYYRQASGTVGKGAGGYAVFAQGDWFFNHGTLYSLKDGAQYGPVPGEILTEETFFGATTKNIVAFNALLQVTEEEVKDRLGRHAIRSAYQIEQRWEFPWSEIAPGIEKLHFKAGATLYGSGPEGKIAAIRILPDGRPPETVWAERVEGEIWSMLPADSRLFVVTREGRIYCFGAEKLSSPVVHAEQPEFPKPAGNAAGQKAELILGENRARAGYALFVGVGDGDLMEQIAARTELHIVGIDPDAEKVADLRRRFDRAGFYGTRIALIPGRLGEVPYPPYISSLIVVEDLAALEQGLGVESLERVYDLLRPFGGKAFVNLPRNAEKPHGLKEFQPANGRISNGPGHLILARDGAIPDTDDWTHQYADAANSVFSRDDKVRLPLGLLWFGGPTNHDVLPRHTTGPRPQVVAGKVILMGVETLSARDIYTGRQLWIREFPGIGHAFTNLELEEQYRAGNPVYMTNIPGATYIGSPLVSLADGIYLRYGGRFLRLDPDTGETLATFELPPSLGNGEEADWGHVSVRDEFLITTTDPHYFDDGAIGWPDNWNGTSSKNLAVLNRFTGEVLWNRAAQIGFRHNAIVTGNGKVFVIDGLSEQAVALMARRGVVPTAASKILALDVSDGALAWENDSEVFGTWLSYSQEYDILLEGGSRDSRRQLPDEPRERMIARQGSDGSVIWDRGGRYDGPVALRGNEIIPGRPGAARELLTGKDKTRAHPFSGEPIPWSYFRTYGCNTLNASKHLLLFRSGAAGFADLANDGGTGNFGGFRPGCSASMVPANGIITSPDLTRTCGCSYQNQTSLALIHMPDVEIWTSNLLPPGNGTIEQVGLNLGAPGNRRADDGILWVDYPRVGGPAPELKVQVNSDDIRWFRKHSLFVNGPEGYDWVTASGAQGITALTVELVQNAVPASYTVQLFFSEPDRVEPGERVFTIYLQDKLTARNVDVVKEAGGSDRGIQKVFKGVSVDGALKVAFAPDENSGLPPILSGIKILREK